MKLFLNWRKMGIQIPLMYDPVSNKPSITILFAFVTFCLACGSIILLHIFPKLFITTWTTIFFWVIAVVFYLIRKLNKASIDFKQRSINLEHQNSCRDTNNLEHQNSCRDINS